MDIVIWATLEAQLARYSTSVIGDKLNLATLVPLVAMIAHFAIFSVVTLLGSLTLRLASVRHACVHLMFFFQFFDALFLYVLFNLRAASHSITPTWALMQVLMQVWVVLRNSGTNDALLSMLDSKSGALVALLTCTDHVAGFREADPLRDPLYRLQYLARLAVQADLADLCAIVLTPTAVAFFVWRDGWFTLEGTGILVRHCDLPQVFARFGLLLLLKPLGATLARCLMIRKMRKTLLGKKTLHGRSLVASKAIAHRRTVRSSMADASGGAGAGVGGALDEQRQQRELALTEEELLSVHDELLLSVLDFRILAIKLVKKYKFFSMVVLLQLFLALPVRSTAPLDDSVALAPSSNASTPTPYFSVARQGVWTYVPPQLALQSDERLRLAFSRTFADEATNVRNATALNATACLVDVASFRGWWSDMAERNSGTHVALGAGLLLVLALFVGLSWHASDLRRGSINVRQRVRAASGIWRRGGRPAGAHAAALEESVTIDIDEAIHFARHSGAGPFSMPESPSGWADLVRAAKHRTEPLILGVPGRPSTYRNAGFHEFAQCTTTPPARAAPAWGEDDEAMVDEDDALAELAVFERASFRSCYLGNDSAGEDTAPARPSFYGEL